MPVLPPVMRNVFPLRDGREEGWNILLIVIEVIAAKDAGLTGTEKGNTSYIAKQCAILILVVRSQTQPLRLMTQLARNIHN